VARPGQTAIREGNTARTIGDVQVDRQVHVKGTMINGGRPSERIELEGKVASGTSASFVLQVQGNRASGPVQVDGSTATFQCNPSSGPNAIPPDQCLASVKAGAQVHVRGTLLTCDQTSATVRADKVIVQK
jgi:hypothetical protein